MTIQVATGTAPLVIPFATRDGPWINHRYWLSCWYRNSTINTRNVLALTGNTANDQDVDALSIPFPAKLELDIKLGNSYVYGGGLLSSVALLDGVDYWFAVQRLNPYRVQCWVAGLTFPPTLLTDSFATAAGMVGRTVSAPGLILGAWDAGATSTNAGAFTNVVMMSGPRFRPLSDAGVKAQWMSQLPLQKAATWLHLPMMTLDGTDVSGAGRNITSLGTATLATNPRLPMGRSRARREAVRGVIPPRQYAYPTADVTDGSWLNESGNNTNLYASVDEATTANDSDYIRSSLSPSGDAVTLGFGTIPTPGSGGGTLRIRHRRV